MKIGVIGGGVVGKATARAFIEHVDEVRVYDVMRERRTYGLDDVLACDLVFVCLPTPQHKDSLECDLRHVEGFFSGTCRGGSGVNFVLRSTVPIGTTHRLRDQYDLPNLIHSPEFLTARCSITDAQLPARNIIGSPGCVWNSQCLRVLRDLYRSRFPGTDLFLMSSDESEAVKLFVNGYAAVTVALWNELRVLADAKKLDWDRVMEGVLSDGRISRNWCKVPGPDGKRGFGGSCLPKDLANLVSCLESENIYTSVAVAALARNTIDRERA